MAYSPPCRGNPDLWTEPKSRATNVDAATACLSCKLRAECARLMGDDLWTIHGGNAAEILQRKGRPYAAKQSSAVVRIGGRGQCNICGDMFVKSRNKQVTCGRRECIDKNSVRAAVARVARVRKGIKNPPRRCLECKELIENAHGNQLYHAGACRDAAVKKTKRTNNKRRWQEMEHRSCAWCGEDFLTNRRGRARLCSRQCRDISRTITMSHARAAAVERRLKEDAQ